MIDSNQTETVGVKGMYHRLLETFTGKSNDLLFGFYTIIFGLSTDYAVTRAMQMIFPGGVAHFISDPFGIAVWRLFSMVVCAMTVVIIFVHGSVAVVNMRLHQSLLMTYLRVFYTFYLSLAPWLSLHVARLVLRVFVTDFSIDVDVIFLSLYMAGFLFLEFIAVPAGKALLKKNLIP